MARLFAFLLFIFGLLFVTLVYAKPPEDAPHKAVIVELFTSEGCSSCPPADTLLGQLRQDAANGGVEVIPLGFHVDYWNYLGWQDRFSSHAYSQRQEKYSATLRTQGPYTPQMVVNGSDEFVGSDSTRARSAISRAANTALSASIDLKIAAPDKLLVRIKAPVATSPGNSSPAGANNDVWLAITEDNLTNKIGAGENGGRTLRHQAVVRDFRLLGHLSNSNFQGEVPLNIAKDWKRADLRAVVFVQEPGTGRISGAAAMKLP
jgi:hypothetical protein